MVVAYFANQYGVDERCCQITRTPWMTGINDRGIKIPSSAFLLAQYTLAGTASLVIVSFGWVELRASR